VLARVLQHRLALRAALSALALALIAYGVLTHAAKGRTLAPALPAKALSGAPTTVAALHGHPTAVVFYAAWCTDCHVEAPAVARFASSSAGRGRIVAVDDDDFGDPHAFVSHYRWNFPVLSDPDGIASDAYGVLHLPTTVILNADGHIVARDPGPQTVASLTDALAAAR
jgi:cytochrome c biogenesis protein CcmG, thiol:disulfide interchange protein DsbE